MTYRFEKETKDLQKIRKIKKELPIFISQFDISMSNQGFSHRTRLDYMRDLRLFFQFLMETGYSHAETMRDITISELEDLNRNAIESFLATFDLSRKSSNHENNVEKIRAKSRRLSAVRSMYNYYCKSGDMKINPAALVAMPKLKEKEVVVLQPEEIQQIIRCIDTGAGLTDKQRVYAEKTRLRDKAIFYTLVGTGIRISECVGLDVPDVDFYNASFTVIRKGGDEDTVFFPAEVEDILQEYIDAGRDLLKPETDALFVSLSHGRLTDRAIENLVKKYVTAAGITNKRIKVHTLRASFATNLYNETGDIYMVKDALHHSSLNTSKHYISGKQDRKRKAAKVSSSLFS